MLRFLADTFLLEGFGFDAPKGVADLGIYLPGRGDVTLEEALAGRDPERPVIGICFYRSHRLTGNTAFVDGSVAAIEAAGRRRRCRSGATRCAAATTTAASRRSSCSTATSTR